MTKLIATIRIGDKVIPMRSPISNFMYLLHASFGQTTNANVIDTGNTARTVGGISTGGSQFCWAGAAGASAHPLAGIDTWGIQVGSNATAVALTDYKLNTQITHGTGAGALLYSAQGELISAGSGAAGTSRSFRINRYFVNGSGGAVTIREVGLVLRPGTTAAAYYNVLVCRDLTGDVAVADTEAVPVEFTWQVTA